MKNVWIFSYKEKPNYLSCTKSFNTDKILNIDYSLNTEKKSILCMFNVTHKSPILDALVINVQFR